MHRTHRDPLVLVLSLAFCSVAAALGWTTELPLKDGRVLKGKLGQLKGVADKPELTGRGEDVQLIYFVHDDLRRTYVCRWQIAGLPRPEQGSETPEKFKLVRKVAQVKDVVTKAGPISQIQPFNEYGYRRLKMATTRGLEDVVQAITEITPTYTKVEGVTHTWDMRIATSSIPSDTLGKILASATKQADLEQRKKVVRFYVQCDRYEEASKELERIFADFPGQADLKAQLEPALRQIREASGRQLLNLLKLGREAGQHRRVTELLGKFPSEGPAGETMQEALKMVEEYKSQEAARRQVLAKLDALAGKVEDKYVRGRVERIGKEIHAELSFNTLGRMAAFREMGEDEGLKPEEKLALAISGWLVDSKGATTKLSTALSLVEVRSLVRNYLAATDKPARAQVFTHFQSEEAATPELVARLLANMKPPVATEPQPEDPAQPIELEVPGAGSAPAVRYLVQLPPEYDPYRPYPAIVTLHGGGSTPEMQIEWWGGAAAKPGQARLRGYVVIAPAWTTEHQSQYRSSVREHAAVLDCLRDACRRFSIDTDRVFLSGHSMGGDAAWDIGLAHPGLWAGVMPIAAKASRVCNLMWENAKLLPLYFVCGELDPQRGVADNARDWNRYLQTPGFNVTLVEYLGRGHEHFSDEILQLFEWMGHFRRNVFPREFRVASMRPCDNFFWWVEIKQIPESAIFDPEDRSSSRRGPRPITTSGSITKAESIRVQTGARQVTVWLSPEMADLKRRLSITIKGQSQPNTAQITPEVAVLLEDARTRGDRLHPFWAKVETPGSRGPAGP